MLSFLHTSRYFPEIFRVCLSHVCAKLTKKLWPLLNQPASYGPFRPKLRWHLEAVFVEIFWNRKNWGGFRPLPVTHRKEIWISWKKRRFEIFRTLASPSHNDVHALINVDAFNSIYLIFPKFFMMFLFSLYIGYVWGILQNQMIEVT